MNIPQILNDLLVPPVEYRNAQNYDVLVDTWEDARPLPSLTEIEAQWPATQARLAAEKSVADDIEEIRESGKDVALVVVRLVDWILANTAMEPLDFRAEVRQSYQELKVIADRLDPPP